jgi:glycosyltransferase involved in cell wall biosynthesis
MNRGKHPYLPDSLSIVIPAYNEESRIVNELDDYCSFIEESDVAWNIIVSIDGSDRTESIVIDFSSRYSFVTKDKKDGRNGKGEAVRRVLDKVNTPYVMLADSDNSIGISELARCMSYLSEYDAVLPDRYDGGRSEMPLSRRFMGRTFNMLVKCFMGINTTDTQCGYKLFRTDKFKESMSRVGITNAFFDVSLLYHLKKNGAKSISVSVNYKHTGGSTFSPLLLAAGHGISLLAFRVYHCRFGRYVPRSIRDLYLRKFRWI